MAGFKLAVGQSQVLNWGPGPARAHLDTINGYLLDRVPNDVPIFNDTGIGVSSVNFSYGSQGSYVGREDYLQLNASSLYDVGTWGQYRGEYQFRTLGYGNAPTRGSSWHQRSVGIINNSQYDLFIPDKTYSEKKAVFYFISRVPGVQVIQNSYRSLNEFAFVTDNANIWQETSPYSGSSGYLRNDVGTVGINYAYESAYGNYVSAGNYCLSAEFLNYYSISPRLPGSCPAGWESAGAWSTNTTYLASNVVFKYDGTPIYNGPYLDSTGYSALTPWINYYWNFDASNWGIYSGSTKHDNTNIKNDAIFNATASNILWTYTMSLSDGNAGTAGRPASPYGCPAAAQYFYTAVRACRKSSIPINSNPVYVLDFNTETPIKQGDPSWVSSQQGGFNTYYGYYGYAAFVFYSNGYIGYNSMGNYFNQGPSRWYTSVNDDGSDVSSNYEYRWTIDSFTSTNGQTINSITSLSNSYGMNYGGKTLSYMINTLGYGNFTDWTTISASKTFGFYCPPVVGYTRITGRIQIREIGTGNNLIITSIFDGTTPYFYSPPPPSYS